jgi:hypothetical protein
MTITELQSLHGEAVLVVPPENAQRNPPAGVRGTLLVREVENAGTRVAEVSISLPDMFTERAREKIIPLSAEDVDQLLRSRHHGGHMIMIKEVLNPSVQAR